MSDNKHSLACYKTIVPASIIDELSSNDVTVQEGDTVVLICNVTGVPTPDVTWYRRPAASKMVDRESKLCQMRSLDGTGTGTARCFSQVAIHC